MNKSALQRLEELHEAAYTKLNQTGSSYYEGSLPRILDPCCGSRMFWFDRQDQRCLFGDIRHESIVVTDRTHKEDGTRAVHIHPNVRFDFRNMPFPDDTFYHVIFDPPHLVRAGPRSWLAAKYGKLGDDWQEDIRKGFAECFRVLRPNGTLVFKWNEAQVSLKTILACTDHAPLYGHRAGRLNKTHWSIFMKPESQNQHPHV